MSFDLRKKKKSTMRNHFTQLKMAIVKKSTNNKCWRECGEKGILLDCWWECKLVQPLWKTVCVYMHTKLLQLCPILCNPIDCSLQGSSVHGILEARILGWVAMPFSRGSSWPRDWTYVSYVSLYCRQVLFPLSHLGSPSPALHPSNIYYLSP